MKNSEKIILDLCGGTGSWSKPYKDAGYDVRLITLPMFDVTDPYVIEQCVALKPYGILAAPPCTRFSKADWRKNKSKRDFKDGMRCVRACMDIIWQVQENGAPLAFWAMENPLGYLYNFMGNPPFFCQNWQFGETGVLATKRTALWGYFNKPARTILSRSIPYVKTHSANKSPERQAAMEVSRVWGGMSSEARAATSSFFATAFFKANK